MRSKTWLGLALAATVQGRRPVTSCESYSHTTTSTFYEYATMYDWGAARGNRGSSSTALTSATLPPASSSTTTGGTGASTSVLIPDDSGTDIVTPSATTSSSLTTTTSSTLSSTILPTTIVTSTDPDVTNNDFLILFNTPSARRRMRKRDIAYIAFDNDELSILVTDQAQAATFTLMNSSLMSGGLFVGYNDAAEPPRVSLEATIPDTPITIIMNSDGTLYFSGIYGFCLQRSGSLVVIADGEESPPECQVLRPELIPAPNVSSTPTSSSPSQTASTATSSVSSTMMTTVADSTTTSSASFDSTVYSASTTSASSQSSSNTSGSVSATDSSMSTSTTTDMMSTSTTDTSTSTTSSTSTSTTSTSTSTTSSTSTSTTTVSTTATTSAGSPIVTDQAYIDTVLRHHNAHRANHTVGNIVWNQNLAATAKKIADTCVYQHDTTTDCPPDANGNQNVCYGQNIGAGYLSTQMGSLISEGFYNGEVNQYTYYGGEPDTSTLNGWGHFSQIVWKDQDSVGCYTTDCTNQPGGLGNVASNSGIQPFFTVCNYNPPGNFIGEFGDNVLASLNQPSIYAGYQCPSASNCVNGST